MAWDLHLARLQGVCTGTHECPKVVLVCNVMGCLPLSQTFLTYQVTCIVVNDHVNSYSTFSSLGGVALETVGAQISY